MLKKWKFLKVSFKLNIYFKIAYHFDPSTSHGYELTAQNLVVNFLKHVRIKFFYPFVLLGLKNLKFV